MMPNIRPRFSTAMLRLTILIPLAGILLTVSPERAAAQAANPVANQTADDASQLRAQQSQRILELQQELEYLQSPAADETAVGELLAIDVELAGMPGSVVQPLQTAALVALAKHGTPAAMEHLHSVFETQTRRRHDAAYAISLVVKQRPADDQDWRYLVRSLTIVQDQQAVSVLQALKRFRRRATKPSWIRAVILIGVQLPPANQDTAVNLLQHWTLHNVSSDLTPTAQLAAYQDWFRKTYPDQPDPVWPTESPQAKHSLTSLLPELQRLPNDAATVAAGAGVFRQANCHKCHRCGEVDGQPLNNRLGPDLTSLGWRRQRGEILMAVLHPSQDLDEEYPSTTVVLQDGRSITGLLMADGDGQMAVVASDGQKTSFAADQMEDTRTSRVSTMPSGLLDPLSQEQVRQLLAFLSATRGTYQPHVAE